MVTTHYEFLQLLHNVRQPRGYLEIGVQTGASLALAQCPAYGVDPNGMSRSPRPNEQIFATTSDDFFAMGLSDLGPIDLVYIDGMHLFEYGLRDFMGALRYANEQTVIVFDDVLPYSPAIAGREQIEGDWTGDVWKMIPIIEQHVDSSTLLVDVWPTGAFVTWNHEPGTLEYLTENYDALVHEYVDREPPAWILDRLAGLDSVEDALKELERR
jgi:hypothetical protein